MAPDGTVYIADAGKPAVVIVSPEREPLIVTDSRLKEPSAVTVLPDRTAAVLDAGASAIWKLQPDGTISDRMIADEGLYGPRGIASATDGTLAVADTGNNRVLLVLPDGSRQSVRNLREPTDVAFLPDGNLLVADTGSRNIRVMRRSGESVSNWSMPTAFTVVGPHVAVLPGGGWVATSPESRGLMRFPPNGRSPETWESGIAWQKPVGIAAGRAGVVVADADAAAVILLGRP
jgi:DNA-binding beta-propeller fold protein YncE